jgi:hypothetical protein
MKTRKFLLFISMAGCGLLAGSWMQAQVSKPGQSGEPEEKWDVTREYDEHGNLIYYDSSYSRTWKHFDLPGFIEGHAFKDLDSLIGDFFHFPDDPFEHLPFAFGPYSRFMDSLDMDWCPDSAWMKPGFTESFFPDSLFPDAFVPFEKFLSPDHLFSHPPDFYDRHEFFERHRERMEKLYEDFSSPEDSLHHFRPKWQQLHRDQKNAARGIEI